MKTIPFTKMQGTGNDFVLLDALRHPVRVTRALPDDRYGDVCVDTRKSMEVYREWIARARPAPGPGGLRRPLHFARAVKPSAKAYRLDG